MLPTQCLRLQNSHPDSCRSLILQMAQKFGTEPDTLRPPPLGEPVTYEPSRNDFVRLVFTILFVMLATTAGFVFAVLYTPELKSFYLSMPILMIVVSSIIIVSMNYLFFCVPSARVGTCSYVCLVVAVLAMSNLVSAVTVKYKTHILMYAFITTAVTVLVCLLLACSKFDFTKFYIYVIAAAVVFMTVSALVAVAMLVYRVRYKPTELLLLFGGTLLGVAFLIIELQMVLGGRSVELTEREHAFGAYILYTAIVDLFLKFVQILGNFEK